MMKVDQIPGRGRIGELGLQPGRLYGTAQNPIRFKAIAVKNEEVHRSPDKIIIAFVAGQGEVILIGQGVACIPIMVAQRGEEAIGCRARAVGPDIRKDELVIILPDILINRVSRAKWIIVVAGGDDEIGVPAFDEVGDVLLGRAILAVIADGGEANRAP